MKKASLILFFALAPLIAHALDRTSISIITDRPLIFKNEKAVLSWDAAGATQCNSYVDVLDAHGKWVWQFSDSWQSASRNSKGTFDAKPVDDARYYLSCMHTGKQVTKFVEVQVLDREKYISGEETPRVPVDFSPEQQTESEMREPRQEATENKAENQGYEIGQQENTNQEQERDSRVSVNDYDSHYSTANPSSTGNINRGDVVFSEPVTKQEVKARIPKEKPLESLAPVNKDSDVDMLSDKDEMRLGTDPRNPDTDGDGYLDGVEVKNKYNPLLKADQKKVKKVFVSKKKALKKKVIKKKALKKKVVKKKALKKKQAIKKSKRKHYVIPSR